jgi:hypothetical protein
MAMLSSQTSDVSAFFDAFLPERNPFRAFLAIRSAATFGQVDLTLDLIVTVGWVEVTRRAE